MWFIFITACLFNDTLLTLWPHDLGANALLRREQSNSACGTFTHIDAGFASARAEGPQYYSLGWSEQRERRPRSGFPNCPEA